MCTYILIHTIWRIHTVQMHIYTHTYTHTIWHTGTIWHIHTVEKHIYIHTWCTRLHTYMIHTCIHTQTHHLTHKHSWDAFPLRIPAHSRCHRDTCIWYQHAMSLRRVRGRFHITQFDTVPADEWSSWKVCVFVCACCMWVHACVSVDVCSESSVFVQY
jgi:hypothetical protein